MKADLCPVCMGTGRYHTISVDNEEKVDHTRACHGCDGKGWVEVHEEVWYASSPMTLPDLYSHITVEQ